MEYGKDSAQSVEPVSGEYQDTRDRQETGRNIHLLRREKDISQDELAERIGHKANGNTVSRIENGHIDVRMSTFFSISEALSVTPNEICPRRLLKGTPLELYQDLKPQDRKIIGSIISALLTNRG